MEPTDNLDNVFEECPSCKGMGYYDIGDSEDGITDECPECNGTGLIEVE